MCHIPRTLLQTVAILLGLGLTASADTLQMKNGEVVQGKYLGGSERAVQFEVNGEVKLFEVGQVLSITFTSATIQGAVSSQAERHAPATFIPPEQGSLMIPAGTQITVRMIDGVDSARNRIGDKFQASLESDLLVDGVVIAPRGADVYGRLAEAEQAGHLSGKAELKLELTDIRIHDRLQPIVTGDYDVAGSGRGKNTAEKVGGGAAIGAIVGAIAGGGKGAAIGAGVGGGAGAAVNVVTRGQQVRVPSETLLDFRLQQPLTVRIP